MEFEQLFIDALMNTEISIEYLQNLFLLCDSHLVAKEINMSRSHEYKSDNIDMSLVDFKGTGIYPWISLNMEFLGKNIRITHHTMNGTIIIIDGKMDCNVPRAKLSDLLGIKRIKRAN